MSHALIMRYTGFAVLATAANIASQWLSFQVYGGAFALGVAMLIGTGVGLIVKYVLDKRWIFFDAEGGLRAHGRKFSLYTLMGVVTTLLFWATEIAFDALSDAAHMKYVGAAIGLGIGYAVKYQLDRRFVFRSAVP